MCVYIIYTYTNAYIYIYIYKIHPNMQDVCLLAGVIDGKGRHIAQLEDLGIYI